MAGGVRATLARRVHRPRPRDVFDDAVNRRTVLVNSDNGDAVYASRKVGP